MGTKAIIFLVSFFFAALPFSAEASVFHIRFQYDRQTDRLSFDETKGLPIEVDQESDMNPMEFSEVDSAGSFALAFFFDDGTEIIRKNFDPSKFSDKSFSLDAPYLSSAKSASVYRIGSSVPILSLDLSLFMTCDGNGVCEYESGENFDTCIPDCVGTVVAFSEETKKLLKQNNNVLTDSKTGEILLRGTQPVVTPGVFDGEASGKGMVVALIIGGVAMLLIGLGIFALFRLRRRNRQYGL